MTKALPSLKAMAEGKVEGVSKTTHFSVDANRIKFEDGFNGRPIDRDHVDALKLSRRNGGTWPEVTVRVEGGEIICVDGHHRTVAAIELSFEDAEFLPMLDAIQFRGNDADRVMLMITSQQGKPLTPLQLGLQYKKMVGFNWSLTQIAARIGKSRQHVSDMLTLADSNSDVQQMVERGEVAAHVALKQVKKHGSKAGAVLKVAQKESGGKKVTNKTMRVATPDATMSLVQAIEQEIESKGEIMAETLCPEYAHLVVYLRAAGLK